MLLGRYTLRRWPAELRPVFGLDQKGLDNERRGKAKGMPESQGKSALSLTSLPLMREFVPLRVTSVFPSTCLRSNWSRLVIW